MGSTICFSSATILRCTYLAPLQTIALVIPTVLEVLSTSTLIFKHNTGGRQHLLLTAEGWIYFLLSVLQMISEIVPAVRDNLYVRRAFDTGIGVASFFPLFLYTFFFFVFSSNELLETLPDRVINVAKYSLVLFIPAIVVFNEIASFTGIAIRSAIPPYAPPGSPLVLEFVFLDKRSELLWSFFTSLTLALLTAFQAAVFSFAFFRVVRAILNQRRIEIRGSDKAHMFNGIVWLCGGVKIGALESLVGLFGGGFGMALARRIMRMISRACMAVGIAKGVDVIEDFRLIQRELRKGSESRRAQRRSRLREFISNPRMSTFRTLSPTATSFHASSRGQPSIMEKDESTIGQHPHYITVSQRQSYLAGRSGLPGMKDFAAVREERLNRRVTVLQSPESAPKLQVRFSALDVPAPVLLASDIKIRSQSGLLDDLITTKLAALDTATEGSAYDEKGEALQFPQPHFHGGATTDSQHRNSNNSSLGSPYEIVDAHKLTQVVAVGQLYRPQAMRTPTTAALGRDTATTPLSGQPLLEPPGLRPESVEDSRVKSLVSVKTNSITAAVRELADKFPGPPDVSKTRPVVSNNPAFLLRRPQIPPVPLVEEKSVWEEDSRTSLAAGTTPQAVGTPSEVSHVHAQVSHSEVTGEDDRAYVSGENSPLAFAPPSPVKGGKALVTNPNYRISTASRRSRRSEKTRTTGDDDYELSKTPISAPLGVPLRRSLKLSVADTPVPVVRQYGSPATPTTGLSILDRIQESVAPNQADPFTELGKALDTGKSRNFREETTPPMPLPPPAIRVGRFKSEEKLNRVTEWLDRSASFAQEHMDPEAPPTLEELTARPPIVPSPRERSLQNLHDRGKSMDALTIPWVKTPELAEARSTTTAGEATASYEATMRMVGPRIKTVGKAPSRSTPKPTRTALARASLYLQPIIIPPPSGNMPQIEYASPMEFDNGNVLKDSEVLVIENSPAPRQTSGRL